VDEAVGVAVLGEPDLAIDGPDAARPLVVLQLLEEGVGGGG
jgi:hypothetical protein